MANETISIKPDLSDYRGLMHALNKMSDGANRDLREDVLQISAWTAREMAAASTLSMYPDQAEPVARSIRPVRDRVPNVTIGSRRYKVSGGAYAGNLLFGNEFGGPSWFPNGGRRFAFRSDRAPQGRGNKGYWIFPTLRRIQPELTRRWKHAVELRVLTKW